MRRSNNRYQRKLEPWCKRCRNLRLIDGPTLERDGQHYPTLKQCPECMNTGSGVLKQEDPPRLDGPSRAAGERED